MDIIRAIGRSHDKLKHHVHTAWRIPLTKNGQRLAGLVYFSIPCVAGYYIFSFCEEKAKENLADLELVKGKERRGNVTKDNKLIGGAAELGLGGGVRLTTSTGDEQRQNKRMLGELFERLEREKQQADQDKGKK